MDIMIKQIKMNTLRSTSLVKLFSYLMFKSYKNADLEKLIRKDIQKLTIKLNQKSKLGSLHKELDSRHKKVVQLRKKVR
jgi:hypothetical protein